MAKKVRKKIALTMRVVRHSYPTSIEWRDAIAHDWMTYLADQGIDIILVPNREIESLHLLDGIDGLVLTGGDDLLTPEQCAIAEEVASVRDKTEIVLLERAVASSLPVLGVCRGMQAINRYFGGTLGSISPSHPMSEHPVTVLEEGVKLLGTSGPLTVNSYHLYAIDKLASELVAIAHAEDKSIEAFRHRELPIFGVMWHPERACSESKSAVNHRTLLDRLFNKV